MKHITALVIFGVLALALVGCGTQPDHTSPLVPTDAAEPPAADLTGDLAAVGALESDMNVDQIGDIVVDIDESTFR